MLGYKKINSSNLDEAGYDSQTRELIVKFKNGTAYKYFNIPAGLWVDFHDTFTGENGKSAGNFFNAHIKHQTCEKIEESK